MLKAQHRNIFQYDVYQTLRMVSLDGRFWEEIIGVLE
jgi:hypothetical protein